MPGSGIAPVRAARFLHEPAMRALERCSPKLSQRGACVARFQGACMRQQSRKLSRGDRVERFPSRVGALFLRPRGKSRRGPRVQALHEHVPVARGAERGRERAQRAAQALRFFRRQNRLECAQCRAQPAHRDAQLMQVLGVVGRQHRARPHLDLRKRLSCGGLECGARGRRRQAVDPTGALDAFGGRAVRCQKP